MSKQGLEANAPTVSAAALADAVLALRAAGCVFAEDEAEALGSAVADEAELAALVRRRAGGEPLEQVVGYADFGGLRVRLRPGVFVPRVRSELLARRGGEHADQTARHRRDGPVVVVDLCCGSGALGLAVTAHRPRTILYAADIDPNAVACARDNLRSASGSLAGRLGERVFHGDLFDALPDELIGTIDVLLANVPYVATRHIPLLPAEARDHEPRTALDGGADGLDVFRAVVGAAPRWLAPGGVLLSEITEAQVEAATAAVRAAGLRAEVAFDEDLEATVVLGHN